MRDNNSREYSSTILIILTKVCEFSCSLNASRSQQLESHMSLVRESQKFFMVVVPVSVGIASHLSVCEFVCASH